jgi:hypothetical protein
VWFVEEETFHRGATATRCLGRGSSLPELLDEAYADAAAAGILERVGEWLGTFFRRRGDSPPSPVEAR